MARICLVSCVGKKLNRAARSEDLYISAWFRKARGYASQHDRWYILSAKHGLVEPSSVIEPYEMTLRTMKKRDRERWAERVFHSLCCKTEADDAMVFLAGQAYRETLVLVLRQRGNRIEVPMERMRIGEQLQWLTRQSLRP